MICFFSFVAAKIPDASLAQLVLTELELMRNFQN